METERIDHIGKILRRFLTRGETVNWDEVALVQSWQFLMKTEEQIRKNMYKRVQKAMERGETDNITVIYIEQKEQ